LCTVAINVLVPRAFNPESQYFIILEIQPGGDEASNEGCNSGPTGKGFTDNSIIKEFTGP
jgi:hypothetical protein